MKHSVLALTVTGLLAVGAGVAIAGLPSTPPGDDLVIREPRATTTTTVTLPTAAIEPIVTEPTGPSTSAVTTTTTADTTDSSNPATTTTSGPPAELRSITELVVATANATNVGGVAGNQRDILRIAGYSNVTALDAEPSDVSAVYYDDGFEPEAARLAEDLGWGADAIAPMADMPTLLTDLTFDIVVVIGQDRV